MYFIYLFITLKIIDSAGRKIRSKPEIHIEESIIIKSKIQMELLKLRFSLIPHIFQSPAPSEITRLGRNCPCMTIGLKSDLHQRFSDTEALFTRLVDLLPAKLKNQMTLRLEPNTGKLYYKF